MEVFDCIFRMSIEVPKHLKVGDLQFTFGGIYFQKIIKSPVKPNVGMRFSYDNWATGKLVDVCYDIKKQIFYCESESSSGELKTRVDLVKLVSYFLKERQWDWGNNDLFPHLLRDARNFQED